MDFVQMRGGEIICTKAKRTALFPQENVPNYTVTVPNLVAHHQVTATVTNNSAAQTKTSPQTSRSQWRRGPHTSRSQGRRGPQTSCGQWRRRPQTSRSQWRTGQGACRRRRTIGGHWCWAQTCSCVDVCNGQAPAGLRIFNPGISGTGFCKIPGSRDFLGRD